MSDFNDQVKKKQELLKQIIKELHDGVPVEKLQRKFRSIIKDTSPDEIADMENALIEEGFPASEVQRLCDVHAQVFEKTLSRVGKPNKIPGHPIFTFLQENKEARRIIKKLSKLAKKLKSKTPNQPDIADFEHEFNLLKEIEKHYQRKENQLFPALEEKNFTGPTKVMWGKHDEIRNQIKKTESYLRQRGWDNLYKQSKNLIAAIKKMIFLEEKILYPTSAKKLTTNDWIKIKKGESEIGYAWVTPSNLWDAELAKGLGEEEEKKEEDIIPQEAGEEKIKLDEGYLSKEQLTLLLKNLPVDITFVDEYDQVCFYSANEDRIFPRSPAIIGRAVQNCHPPDSVNVVKDILQSFREKKKKVAEFWIQSREKFIHIRYFPMYDEKREYRGVLEVSQDVTGIKKLEGERKILDW